MVVADGCKTRDSSYRHSFIRRESQSIALLGRAVPLLRLINAARLFQQGPSTELPSHRAAACVTELQFMDSLPVSPQRVAQNAILRFLTVKFNFFLKKSATKFLCVITSSGKVVATSFPYLTVHRWIADDSPPPEICAKSDPPLFEHPKFLTNSRMHSIEWL